MKNKKQTNNIYLDDLLRIRAKKHDKTLTTEQKAYNDFAYLVTATKYLNMTTDEVLNRSERYTQHQEHPGWKDYKSRQYRSFKNAQTYTTKKGVI